MSCARPDASARTLLTLQLRRATQALKELQALIARMRSRWDVRKVAVAHRTGVVPVGQASVVIAVSSAHRQAALEATHWGIDELKATVPIWKKEFYAGDNGDDGGAVWKANAEAPGVMQQR